jgi:hypothetical protein
MSYNLEQHLQAERSRNVSRSKISQFRRDRKAFIKYGKRRIQANIDDFNTGSYVSRVENGKATQVRSYTE